MTSAIAKNVGGAVALLALTLLGDADVALAKSPTIAPVAGRPVLLLSGFDLTLVGYTSQEFFVSGTASSYKLNRTATANGNWNIAAADSAPYITRIVALRPADPKKFNGTVVVEWLNVSAGTDATPDWNDAHRELIRQGYAYVGVSAQKVGIDGGGIMGAMGQPLKTANPQRYASLSHPGDAYSFDMFSQVGDLLRQHDASGILGGLKPKHILAVGESQSAVFLTTYVNAVDPLAKVYDGFLIHSRFGPSAQLDGKSIRDAASVLPAVKLRDNLRVPVITVITETDLVGGGLTGFYGARQPDNAHLRVWEMPGTSHADIYTFGAGFVDSGMTPIDKLAAAWHPMDKILGMQLAKPVNAAPQHHYIVEAALANLNTWVESGAAPPHAQPMTATAGEQPSSPPTLVRDANGETEGGIRTPWVDVPVATYSGGGNSGGQLATLAGSTQPFDQATLDRLYPGGKSEYLKKFEASLDATIQAGFILPADKVEIMQIAALNYTGTH
jgi:hypothetical protein